MRLSVSEQSELFSAVFGEQAVLSVSGARLVLNLSYNPRPSPSKHARLSSAAAALLLP